MKMKPTTEIWMKFAYLHFLYLFCGFTLMASDDLPFPDQSTNKFPSAEQITNIQIDPPGISWVITIYRDGRVSAQYGQGPEDNMGMPPGTISFERICRLLLTSVPNATPHSNTQITFFTAGKVALSSRYLRDDTLLRYLFPNDPSNWRTLIPILETNKITISPISPRAKEILQKYPIYKPD
jgi:hypothetical protein